MIASYLVRLDEQFFTGAVEIFNQSINQLDYSLQLIWLYLHSRPVSIASVHRFTLFVVEIYSNLAVGSARHWSREWAERVDWSVAGTWVIVVSVWWGTIRVSMSADLWDCEPAGTLATWRYLQRVTTHKYASCPCLLDKISRDNDV